MLTADQKKQEFIAAYSQYSDDIFRYLLFRVYDRGVAKELVQEAFTRTWKYISEGKEIKNIRAFVYKTAYHLAIDESRKKKESSLDFLLESGFNVPDNQSIDRREKIDCLAAMQELEKLEEDFREVLLLRHVEGLGVKEIAEILDLSENIISVRIHRGLKQLHANIEK